jgi:UDP-2,3-diacylglucosamine pyrophosphatase LpxH
MTQPNFSSVHYRTVFISDVHLGTPDCQADLLLDFLRHLACDRLFLVGDIVDGWRMKRGWFWPQAHNDVVQKLLRIARKGAEVTYIPGNHDDRVRDFCGVHFGGVEVAREAVHVTADGRRFLVTHGDAFDALVRASAVKSLLGDLAYKALVALNTRLNRLRRRMGLGYWSLSSHVKSSVKGARRFIETFERGAAAEALSRGFDGVICGHVHRAAMREIDGALYVNDGDWVESCTALVEHADGRLEILDWAGRRSWSMMAEDARRDAAPWTILDPAPA